MATKGAPPRGPDRRHPAAIAADRAAAVAAERVAKLDDAFVNLEARHVDNLTSSVRNLSHHIARLGELVLKSTDATRESNTLARELSKEISELAKLLKNTRDEAPSQVTPSGRTKKT